ncbi:oligopeptide/dipeptide ABC transporter ATP-binding protein [Fibrobacterota bacterium]
MKTAMQTLVEAKNLVKKFSLGDSEFLAVDDVSLEIKPGKTYGLVGESACGKSTVALSLLALQTVDSGEVWFNGKNILALPKPRLRELRRHIRLLFQNPEAVLNSGMTVSQVLYEELEKEKEMSRQQKQELIWQTIKQVGLNEGHLLRHPPGLSTGEKQRAAIARAIITRPKFLVCDEPVASLDMSLKSSIIELLMDLQYQLDLSYLYISHNLGLVRKMAHNIGIMYMGNLVEEAPVEFFTVHRVLHPYSKLLLASVPSTFPDEFHEILKDYPDVEPSRFQEGCPFRNRCPFYLSNPIRPCETRNPRLVNHGDNRKVACHQVKSAVYKGLWGLSTGV